MRFFMICIALVGCPLWLFAQGADWEKANDAYQGALQAYLQGDFDQAILLDTRALQTDPENQKAADLLAVLIQEKEQNRKTEIWIGSGKTVNPVFVGVPVISASPLPVAVAPPKVPKVVKKKVRQTPTIQTAVDLAQKAALDSRLETILLLMGRNASEQYHELTSAQVDTFKKVNENLGEIKALQSQVNETQRGSEDLMNWMIGFQFLALFLAVIAMIMASRARQEVRRLRYLLEGNGFKKNIVPMDGTFSR
jgi:hypothetical protein